MTAEVAAVIRALEDTISTLESRLAARRREIEKLRRKLGLRPRWPPHKYGDEDASLRERGLY
jgi:hypothetical protein